jgi:uncharacterized protein YqjF (DUF2071 family)
LVGQSGLVTQEAVAPMGGVCPFTVDDPVMLHRWERLTFLHWPFETDVVQRLVPDWLEVETFDGAAWVGLVPFYMRVANGRGRGAGYFSNFCETNVRTYVRDRENRSGIWFFSLDAARLAPVVVARATYRLPYFWSRMRLEQHGDEMAYDARRLAPGTRGSPTTSRVRINIGHPYTTAELQPRDQFLTARFVLFSSHGSRRRFARAAHAPWSLHHADAVDVDDGLVAAAGLPRSAEAPLVHYSPGVDVRIGRPEHYSSRM